MNGWQSGSVDRSSISKVVRRFAPAQTADGLAHVSLNELWASGKRLILLDVDHTLVEWRGEEFLPDVEAWVAKAKRAGFDLCILSNTRRPERLTRLAGRLGIPFIRDKFKPSPAMYRLAMIKFSRKAEEVVMIGDQLMTDVWGANRAGIDAIWVRKLDSPEFFGTRFVSRNIERLIQGSVWKALAVTEDERRDPVAMTLTQQLVRFAVVGGSSFLINAFVRWVLLFQTPFAIGVGPWARANVAWLANRDTDILAATPFAAALGGAVAMVNAFYWNRRWTFEAQGHLPRRTQAVRFFIVAGSAEVVNALCSGAISHALSGSEGRRVAVATILATGVAAVWNFTGQRLFAFRRRSA